MSLQTIEYPKECLAYSLSSWLDDETRPFADENELDEWQVKGTIDWYEIKIEVAKPKELDIAVEFSNLAKQWEEETWAYSSVKRRVLHPAYLKIIGMGPVAIPLLLKQLRARPDHWFHALEAITRQDPSPDGSSMREIVEAWIAWGDKRGYRSSR